MHQSVKLTDAIFKFKFKFKSVYCISCKVFIKSNSTINQILSIKTYYTTNTQIVNKVTNYIMLGVGGWFELYSYLDFRV